MACKNFSDALGFLISAAKKKRIVIDGLIKKRALKHIAKVAEKANKIIINNQYSNLYFNETFIGLNNKKMPKINYNTKNEVNLNGTEDFCGM